MGNEETRVPEAQDFSSEDTKKLKQLKVAYPVQQLGGGIEKAYLSTYLSYLYTNVYMIGIFSPPLILVVYQINIV